MIVINFGFEWRALFLKVGNQFSQTARIHHRARKDMRTNSGAFLDDRDLNLAQRITVLLVVLSDQIRQMECAAEIRRTRADEDHVHL